MSTYKTKKNQKKGGYIHIYGHSGQFENTCNAIFSPGNYFEMENVTEKWLHATC